MAVIDIVITPQHATRVFFDCRDCAADPADAARIEQVIGQAVALDQDDADSRHPVQEGLVTAG